MGTYGDAFNTAVAAELRAERGRRKMTVDAIVVVTGLSKSAVLNYLNDKREIPTGALADISAALGVSPRIIAERAENAIEEN